MIKKFSLNGVELIAPRLIWRIRIKAWKINTGETEERLLPWLCASRKISIDVGGAAGAYSARLLLYSSRVVIFEPHPESATDLRRLFLHTRIVTLEQIALSDNAGVVTLRIPAERPMRSTIEQANDLGDTTISECVAVERRCLDDYNLTPVGFIKIDVEGHEIAVLAGARSTIERERPNLLIEIEDQHNPTSLKQTTRFLDALNYVGYFLFGNKLVDIRSFDQKIHQDRRNLVDGHRRGTYINNFVFLPKEWVKHIPRKFMPVRDGG